MRSVELFLQTLQTGGDLAAQLEAVLSRQRSVSPDAIADLGLAKETTVCDMCTNAAEELKRERENRAKLEEKCATQQRRIAELEKMVAAVD